MDPDADIIPSPPPPVETPPISGSNGRNNRSNRDHRGGTGDRVAALPNSSRRAAGASSRSSNRPRSGGSEGKPPPSSSSRYDKPSSSSSSRYKSSRDRHHGGGSSRSAHCQSRREKGRDSSDRDSDRERRVTRREKESSSSSRHHQSDRNRDRNHKSEGSRHDTQQHSSSSSRRRGEDRKRHEEQSDGESSSESEIFIEYSDSSSEESSHEDNGPSCIQDHIAQALDRQVESDDGDDDYAGSGVDVEIQSSTNYDKHHSNSSGTGSGSDRNNNSSGQQHQQLQRRHYARGHGRDDFSAYAPSNKEGKDEEQLRRRGRNAYEENNQSDPPTALELAVQRPETPDQQLLEPHYEDDSVGQYSRLNAPPSPAGPERNNKYGSIEGSNSRSGTASGGVSGGYSNYELDEEGLRQYRHKHGNMDDNSDHCEPSRDDASLAVSEGMSKLTLRGQDPPESGRGCDPKQTDAPRQHHGNTYRSASGNSKYRSSRSGRSEARAVQGKSRNNDEAPIKSIAEDNDNEDDSIKKKRKKKKRPKKKEPEIKGILKKKGAPIPITQFGKPINISQTSTPQDSGMSSDNNSVLSSGSDPDMIEQKSTKKAASLSKDNSEDNKGGMEHHHEEDIKSVNAKSGLRSGKYASVNVAAASKQAAGEESDSDYNSDDYTGDNASNANDYNSKVGGDDQSNHKHDDKEEVEDDDNNDDDDTFKTISSSANERFDRTKSHFLRTADLGLTQDTIFAEQFLDDPSAKAEPHYHHPSPHPPPGVQFHIDENWVSLDDGKGGHSPIAPQAVDALVAMGYRAACDPMMWTPSSKTRKYMTEKGLRFDDIPIPGPIDEGEGGPNSDSTGTLVWSGKFPHKYHGHEQPAIRSQGIVNMSPEQLVDLLMDSKRVSEYNKSSIGRVDEVVLSDGTDLDGCPFSGQRKKKLTGVIIQGARIVDGTAVIDSETDDEQSDVEEITFDDDGRKSVRTITTASARRQSLFVGVTKLVRTTNKPPLVRKVLEFFTLLHCRKLTDEQGRDGGYIIVGRGVTPAGDVEKSSKGVMHSEILLNVHIIRRLRPKSRRDKSMGGSKKGNRGSKTVSTSGRKASRSDLAGRCLMINVNHLKSPMVPNMLAKKVGLGAALNFISDIRALTGDEM